jgi:catechol 2,3-dioxygenase-like lactoylglutathione lyase family enzyme
MNDALDRLAQEVSLHSGSERLRLEFGYACACRVEQFVEQAEVLECLRGLGAFLSGSIDRVELQTLAAKAATLANQHQGSRSLDGAGHAAVSASCAVANALAGKARQAADYAAYAAVYGQGGYGAVADRESFEPELAWQVHCLSQLVSQQVVPLRAANPSLKPTRDGRRPGAHIGPHRASQSSARSGEDMPPELQAFDHVHVFVTHLASAEKWYSEVLGLHRTKELEFWAKDGGPLTIQNRSGSIHLALFESAAQSCRSTVALRVGAAEYVAWKEHLQRLLPGQVSEEDHQVSLSLYFSDPDRNPFEVTTYDVNAPECGDASAA